MGNNPVNSTDSDGGDDVYFNKDGSYKTTDKKNWLVNLFVGHRGYIEEGDGSLTRIQFNDQMDALSFGEGKKYQGIVIVADDEVKAMVMSGINKFKDNTPTTKSAFKFYQHLMNASMGSKELDFSGATSHGYLTVLDGRAYNDMDFGNFLWGLSLQRMGVAYSSVEIGSEINAFWNGKLQNNQWKPTEPSLKRITWTGDTSSDQGAIKNGYKWGVYNMGLKNFSFY
jgi:hypothetical protein